MDINCEMLLHEMGGHIAVVVAVVTVAVGQITFDRGNVQSSMCVHILKGMCPHTLKRAHTHTEKYICVHVCAQVIWL